MVHAILSLLRGVGWCVLLIAVLVIAGCGGGGATSGNSTSPKIDVTPQPAKALQFVYYGNVPGMTAQVQDHVTAVMVPPWTENQIPYLVEAKTAGLPVVLYPKPTPDIYQQWVQLQSLGLLGDVAYVYPCDEPDINTCPDPATVKTTMKLFPELNRAKLAVIYSASGQYPGIEHYDIVGVDDYVVGAGVLNGKNADLRSRLKPGQRLILVPGGADPWRTDPKPFLDYALADDKVEMIMPFTWFDRADGKGIGSNGMAEAYRAVGKQIK